MKYDWLSSVAIFTPGWATPSPKFPGPIANGGQNQEAVFQIRRDLLQLDFLDPGQL